MTRLNEAIDDGDVAEIMAAHKVHMWTHDDEMPLWVVDSADEQGLLALELELTTGEAKTTVVPATGDVGAITSGLITLGFDPAGARNRAMSLTHRLTSSNTTEV